MSNKTLKIR